MKKRYDYKYLLSLKETGKLCSWIRQHGFSKGAVYKCIQEHRSYTPRKRLGVKEIQPVWDQFDDPLFPYYLVRSVVWDFIRNQGLSRNDVLVSRLTDYLYDFALTVDLTNIEKRRAYLKKALQRKIKDYFKLGTTKEFFIDSLFPDIKDRGFLTQDDEPNTDIYGGYLK